MEMVFFFSRFCRNPSSQITYKKKLQRPGSSIEQLYYLGATYRTKWERQWMAGFSGISGRYHVKNSIPYVNNHSLCTSYISPQMYLGNFLYVKTEIWKHCSLGRWWAPQHLLVSHRVLAGHLEQASDFQFHICIKRAVSLRSSADKISKNDHGFWSFIFQCLWFLDA